MFTVSLSVVSPTTGATVIEGRSQTTVIIVDDDGRVNIIIVILHVILMSALRDCIYCE